MKRTDVPNSVAWSAFNVFEDKTHDVEEVVLYMRVSSKAQVKRGHGLQSQETRLREYAKFKGYRVVDTFADDLTGKLSGRPGIEELLGKLRSEKGKKRYVVLIDDITRFARSVRAHEDLRDAILEAGGILESPAVEFGHSADSRMIEYVLATMSQHQREKNAEQTVSRMRARLQNGYWCFQPPTGYVHKSVPGHGKLIVRDEPIASIVQEALEGFACGFFETKVEVKRFLESRPDFPKDTSSGTVRHQRVSAMLGRVVYAGMVESPEWGVSLREGQHEGLITFQTFERIQQRLREVARVANRKDVSEDFPLRGAVGCADCGKPMTSCWSKSKTGKKHPYYMCFNKPCSSYRKSIRRDEVEDAFEALLKEIEPKQRVFVIAKDMFTHIWEGRDAQMKSVLQTAQKQIDGFDEQIGKLLDSVVAASSPTVISAFEKRIEKLEREKLVVAESMKNQTTSHGRFGEKFELAMQFLSSPYKIWINGDLEWKRMVLKLAFSEHLLYSRNGGFRTPKTALPFKVLGDFSISQGRMARPGGFEPPTS